MYSDINIYNDGSNMINSIKYNKWVFSYGGCGTNYMRRLLNIFKIKSKQNTKYREKRYLIKSIHLIKPPKITVKNFVAIFVFGNPILSIESIFRRKLHRIVNVLAGKEIYINKKEMDLNKFLTDYEYDVLRLNEHFDNWINSKTKYPILFIKYDNLGQKLDEIQQKYPKLEINNAIKNIFKKRNSNLDTFSPQQIYKLEKIYGILNHRIKNLPDYWVKYP
jgi:hypothetical protein